MKEGWTYKKLGEICRIGIGRTPSRSDISLWDKNKETHNYWVSIADMGATENGYIFDTKEYISDKAAENIQIIPKGTLLLSFKLTLGKTAIAGTDLYTNEAIANLPFIGNEINREFLSYYFQFFNWEKYSAGDEKVLGKTLNKKKLDVLPVYYPSLEVQQRIVERLDAAFENIDKLKANAEKQLAEARTLFQKSLAKAMEPKEGWEEKNVKDLSLLITKGSSPKWQGNSYVDSDGILFVTSENVREGSLVFNPAKYVDKSFNQKQRRSILKKDDVLVNIVGASIGRAAIFDIDVEDANINQAVCLVRLDKQILSPRYLCLFLNSEHAFSQYDAMVKDTARANLSLENIGSLKIGVPPLAEQQRIVERLDALSENIRKYEEIQRQIISECDALKQALLRKVFE